MSRALKVLLILVVILIVGSVGLYFYLPTMIANSIATDSGIQIVPKGVKETVNKKMDELPQALKTLEDQGVYITIEDIIKEIDESTNEEIEDVIEKLQATELTTTDQVIKIVLDNMDFGKLENEKVIAVAKSKMKMSDVKKGMKMIRENGKPYVLTIPMGKETLKQLLLEKQKEVEKKLNS